MSILEVSGIRKVYTGRFGGHKVEALRCVRRSTKSPRPGKLSSGSAEIEQWDRPD